MGRRTKTKQGTLGRAILNARSRKEKQELSELHSTNFQPKERDLKSIIETNDLTEFLTHADLANRDFTAEREVVTIVVNDLPQTFAVNQLDETLVEHTGSELLELQLPIPRRPQWSRSMTKLELANLEKDSFLEWRRSLAEAEEQTKHVLTPFEKNIEVWRQLWRVIEKSDIVVQIVDARNPLLFRCVDLDRYVKEVDRLKTSILVINKSDLLTKAQRFQWARYFRAKKIKYMFWSAFMEQTKQEEKHKMRARRLADRLSSLGISDVIGKSELSAEQRRIQAEEMDKYEQEDIDEQENVDLPSEDNWTHIYTREQLLKHLEKMVLKVKKAAKAAGVQHQPPPPPPVAKGKALHQQKKNARNGVESATPTPATTTVPDIERVTIGMVGYPNVGKSSTINVLCAEKKVAVAATPGKTKHFQTVPISDRIMLCDCPGLVFPSVTTTKAAMVCDGILPIDQLREYRAPVALICKRIPRDVFEMLYGIKLPIKLSQIDPKKPVLPQLGAEELLCAHARIRGFMSPKGLPDESRSARAMLKDYVEGKLLYCHPPPALKSDEVSAAVAEATRKAKVELMREDAAIAAASAARKAKQQQQQQQQQQQEEESEEEEEDEEEEDEEDGEGEYEDIEDEDEDGVDVLETIEHQEGEEEDDEEEEADDDEDEWEDIEPADDDYELDDAEIARLMAAEAASSSSSNKQSAATVSSIEFNMNNVIVSKKQKEMQKVKQQFENDHQSHSAPQSAGYRVSYSVQRGASGASASSSASTTATTTTAASAKRRVR